MLETCEKERKKWFGGWYVHRNANEEDPGKAKQSASNSVFKLVL